MSRPRKPFGADQPGRLMATMLKVLAAEMSDQQRLARGADGAGRRVQPALAGDGDLHDTTTRCSLGGQTAEFFSSLLHRPLHLLGLLEQVAHLAERTGHLRFLSNSSRVTNSCSPDHSSRRPSYISTTRLVKGSSLPGFWAAASSMITLI